MWRLSLREPHHQDQARASPVPRAREDRKEAGQNMSETIRRILVLMLTRTVYLDESLVGLSDADIEMGLHLSEDDKKIVDQTTAAILEIYRGELEHSIGQVITKIRGSEGIDPDLIDQVFGVEQFDL